MKTLLLTAEQEALWLKPHSPKASGGFLRAQSWHSAAKTKATQSKVIYGDIVLDWQENLISESSSCCTILHPHLIQLADGLFYHQIALESILEQGLLNEPNDLSREGRGGAESGPAYP